MAVNADRVEVLGIVLVLCACVAAILAVLSLFGWPWAALVFAALAGAGGVVLIRLAALMPEPEEGKS